MNAGRAIAVLAAAWVAAPAGAQAPWDTLKVCADPNNLPFSNRSEEGFENKLAQIWARELGVEVEYTWFPHRRGFERNTLTAEDAERGGYKCDVIVGVPDGYDLAMTTRPYYRSTYALVYVADRELGIRDPEDLFNLPRAARDVLRIGVFTPSPAAEWLARHGMHEQMVAYSALDGDPDVYPGKIIENELLAGELDAAILWGPIAGYFAARAQPTKVAVVPLRSEPGIQFEFAMAAGVRFGERESRARLEDLMARTAPATTALFAEYHMPIIEDPTERVYVTNEDAGTISIISTATQKVIGEIAGRHAAARRRGQPRRRARLCCAVGLTEVSADDAGRGVREARRRQDQGRHRRHRRAPTRGPARASGRLGSGGVRRRRRERSTVRLERGRRRAIDRRPRDRRRVADGRRRRRAGRRAFATGSRAPCTSRARATTR